MAFVQINAPFEFRTRLIDGDISPGREATTLVDGQLQASKDVTVVTVGVTVVTVGTHTNGAK